MVAMCLASREPGPSDKAFSRQHAIDTDVIRLPTTFQRATNMSTTDRSSAAFNLGYGGRLSISLRSNVIAR